MPPILSFKLRRLARYFGITDQEYAWFLSQAVVPTFEVSPFAAEVKIVRLVKSIAAGTGDADGMVSIWTVPPGKRWHVRRLYRPATTGSVAFRLRALGVGTSIIILESTNSTGPVALAVDFFLTAGQEIIIATGDAGDTTPAFAYLINEEDV